MYVGLTFKLVGLPLVRVFGTHLLAMYHLSLENLGPMISINGRQGAHLSDGYDRRTDFFNIGGAHTGS